MAGNEDDPVGLAIEEQKINLKSIREDHETGSVQMDSLKQSMACIRASSEAKLARAKAVVKGEDVPEETDEVPDACEPYTSKPPAPGSGM